MVSRRSDEKWRTIGAAIGSWSRTVRLCLIIVALAVPSGEVAEQVAAEMCVVARA
jgi:hypothetical protein